VANGYWLPEILAEKKRSTEMMLQMNNMVQ